MAGLIFKSLSGSELIEIPNNQFEISLETPDGRRDIKLEHLMSFINDALSGRVTDIETTLASLGLDPENARTITVDGDVSGSASLMADNVTLTLNLPEDGLPQSKVNGLVNLLLGLRLDVNAALDGLDDKLDADGTAVAANKLATPRLINGVLFDGTQDVVVGLTTEQQEQLGTDKHHRHTQDEASAVWTINHNLNKHPSVTSIDSAGTIVNGGIEYIDLNNLQIEFAGAMAGEAFLN